MQCNWFHFYFYSIVQRNVLCNVCWKQESNYRNEKVGDAMTMMFVQGNRLSSDDILDALVAS